MTNQTAQSQDSIVTAKLGEKQTLEIPREKWTQFLNDFSKRRYGWLTRVEVLDGSMGDQILSEGLTLNGVIHEDKSNHCVVEILLGEDHDRHQTHTIMKPVRIVYLNEDETRHGVLQIEEESSTKTLITLMQPMPLSFSYVSTEFVLAA